MPRAPKRCGRFGCENRVVGRTYCPEHAKRPQSPSSRTANLPGERARRKKAVVAWVSVNGWVCPGWERPAHPSKDLTAAHSTAVSAGGVDSVLRVLCRRCNARQGVSPF